MTGRLSARRLVIASALGEAGIDQQLGAVDVARRIAGKEQDGAGHLDGVGDADHRIAAGEGGGAAAHRAAGGRDRKSVGSGKRVTVRVDLGGSRSLTNKKKKNKQ